MKKDTFSKRDILVQLKGEEWFLVLTLLSNPPPPGQLSDKGEALLLRTRKKFIAQIKEHAK